MIIRKNVCASLQVQGACMAARLVGACFSCSLIHPQRPLDFATYTPLELWEGSNLFHDPYRWLTYTLYSCQSAPHQNQEHYCYHTCLVTSVVHCKLEEEAAL